MRSKSNIFDSPVAYSILYFPLFPNKSNVDCDPEKIEMIRTIVSLAWNLGMNVVAEGVETKKQMYQLQALRCDYGQGYYFSRPLDANAVKTLKQFDLQKTGIPPVQPKQQMPTRHVQFPDNSYQQAQTFLLTRILDLSANNSPLKAEDESATFFNSSL